MPSVNRPARLNRSLLLLAGALLLAVAAFILTAAFGLLPLVASGAPLATSPQVPVWVPWATAVTAVLVSVLCLRWLLAQTLRRAKTTTWQLAHDPRRGSTRLAADTAVTPLVEEIETYPGVRQARAELAGSRAHPRLHLRVGTEDRADISELRRRIDTDAIPRMREALELDHLETDLLLRLHDARSTRTR